MARNRKLLQALQTLNEVIEIMSNKKKGLPLMENVKINTKFTLTPTKEAQLLNLLAQVNAAFYVF